MDENKLVADATVSKTEEGSKIKDEYLQLVEKMEQVKTQVAKMERKYDELYQAVKEKDQDKGKENSQEDRESPEQGQNLTEKMFSKSEEDTSRELPTESSDLQKADQKDKSQESVQTLQSPQSPQTPQTTPGAKDEYQNNEDRFAILEDNPFM